MRIPVYPEGTHLILPWYERPVIYDVRAKPYVVESKAGSRDLQMVLVELRVLTHPVADELPTVYRTLVAHPFQGEAMSAKLISQVIANNPAFITLRKIEAAREIARVISDSKSKIYLNADELLLNTQDTNVQ
ncbi:unnamed protein product [Malus baccata var. baccata]